ncbi:hypothetical protein KAT42_04400, partial [Candidatus Bathyarchaeota archaeon]|nr:hypothetical protein [Candidatus Bathyarchaeota archaeon]
TFQFIKTFLLHQPPHAKAKQEAIWDKLQSKKTGGEGGSAARATLQSLRNTNIELRFLKRLLGFRVKPFSDFK